MMQLWAEEIKKNDENEAADEKAGIEGNMNKT